MNDSCLKAGACARSWKPVRLAKHSDVVYLIALGLYMCTQALTMTQYVSDNPILVERLFYVNCIAMALCGIYAVLRGVTTYRGPNLLQWGGLGIFVLSMVVCVVTRVTWFIYPIILMITAVKVPHRKILCLMMVENLVFVFSVVIAAWCRWIPDDPIIRPSEDGPGRLRYTLGFVSPNHIGQLLVSVLLCYYCLYGIRHVLEYVVTLAVSVYSYVVINSRAAAIAVGVLIFVAAATQLIRSDFYIHRVLPVTRYLIFVIPLVWLLLSLWYRPVGLLKILNKLSSKRLYFSKMGLENDGIWPFGHPLKLVSTTESVRTGKPPYVLDNSYVYIAVQFGAVYFLLVLGIYLLLYTRFMRFRDYMLVEALFVILVYAMFENILLRVNINPLPLMLFAGLSANCAGISAESLRGRLTAC